MEHKFVMMKCGHNNNAKCSQSNGIKYDPPVDSCAICGCMEVAETPNLEGRIAKCSYGCNPVPSKVGLAFFKHQPDKEFDQYYCGCYGWD